MDASLIGKVEAENAEIERQRQRHAKAMADMRAEIERTQRNAREAKQQAEELDELSSKVRKAFAAERKRLENVARGADKVARELEKRYDELKDDYAEWERKASISVEDVVRQLVEDRFLEMLRDSQDATKGA